MIALHRWPGRHLAIALILLANCAPSPPSRAPATPPSPASPPVSPSSAPATPASARASDADDPEISRYSTIAEYDQSPEPPPRRSPTRPRCRDARGNDCERLEPVRTRIIGNVTQNDTTIVTIFGGSNHKVAGDWTAQLVDADGQPLPGGTLTILRVDKVITVAKTTLGIDSITANPSVLLTPP